jgi:hypothetical protein
MEHKDYTISVITCVRRKTTYDRIRNKGGPALTSVGALTKLALDRGNSTYVIDIPDAKNYGQTRASNTAGFDDGAVVAEINNALWKLQSKEVEK